MWPCFPVCSAGRDGTKLTSDAAVRLKRNKSVARYAGEDGLRYALALSLSRQFVVRARGTDGNWYSGTCTYACSGGISCAPAFTLWFASTGLVPAVDMINMAWPDRVNVDCRTNAESTHFECFTTRNVDPHSEVRGLWRVPDGHSLTCALSCWPSTASTCGCRARACWPIMPSCLPRIRTILCRFRCRGRHQACRWRMCTEHAVSMGPCTSHMSCRAGHMAVGPMWRYCLLVRVHFHGR
jgi:hypothetical protein